MDMGVTMFVCLVIAFASTISAANVTATVSYSGKQWPYSSIHRQDRQGSVLNGVMLHEDHELNASAMDAHEKRDVEALLCFKMAITSDPLGSLSNWTAQNADNVCSEQGKGLPPIAQLSPPPRTLPPITSTTNSFSRLLHKLCLPRLEPELHTNKAPERDNTVHQALIKEHHEQEHMAPTNTNTRHQEHDHEHGDSASKNAP